MDRRRFKRKGGKKTSIIDVLLFLALIGIGAVLLGNLENTRFSSGTKISGVDCSNLTVEESIEKIEQSEVTLRFSEENTYNVPGTELGRTVTGVEELQSFLAKQNSEEGKDTKTFTLHSTSYSVDVEVMEKYLQSLPELDPANMRESKDAYLEQTEEGLIKIIPEEKGNKINPNEAYNFARMQLGEGNDKINFSSIVYMPKVTQDDDTLVKTMQRINIAVQTKVNYELSDGSTYKLDAETIKTWVYQDENGEYQIELDENVDNFVEGLRKEVERLGLTATVTTKHGTYTLPVGYGWRNKLDVELEKQTLLENLQTGGTHNRKPCYSWYNDFENLETYIEASKGEQNLWQYVDNEEILDAPFISGTKGKHDSPIGIYYSNFKARNYKLRMFGVHIVDTWVTIDGNVGFHDASEWRNDSEYVPDRYEWDGSHGCYNLRKADGRTLYENIVLYETPIIIHN